MWQVFLMYALFGSIFSVGKVALITAPPFFLTAVRMLLAGVILLMWEGKQNIKQQASSFSNCWLLFLGVALFNVFITNGFEFWGLQYMDSGKTCLIYSLSPFAAALIAYFFALEPMTKKKWEGLAIGLSSFIPLMAAPWLQGDNSPLEKWAESALVISAVTSVIGWYGVNALVQTQKFSSNWINGTTFIMAGFISLAVSALFERVNPQALFSFKDFILPLLYIVFIHNIVCYSIYTESLKRFSVTFMAFAGLTNPLFAAFFGWLFLGESISMAFIIAFIGISVGLFLFYREETKKALQTEL